MLPDYLSKAKPSPASARAPWFKNTAPSYAGIFLWIAFYNSIAEGTISRGSLALCLLALAAAGLLSYALYYLAPAMLGMKTGYPLYVVGSSTFGARGGYVMPGLLMGVLQVGWLGVGTFFAAKFILTALGMEAKAGTMPFIVTGVVWGYVMAWIGVMGIQYVAKVATFLNFIPLLMLVVVFARTAPGMAGHVPSEPDSFAAFTLLLQMVIGFFATAGAAGADFGANSRDARDVKWGGLVGIALAAVVAGGLPLLSVAGARVLNPQIQGFHYDTVVAAVGGPLASAMFILFTLACVPPACFSSFIAGNSFSTMIPGVSRMGSTMAGMTVAIILAVTGVAENLVGFFTIVGASFGPICGAVAADYLRSGKQWAGPRAGINWAGYGAWAVGFVVGILPFLPVPAEIQRLAQPAVLYSFVVGFGVYWALASAGFEPQAVKMPGR
jgi:cytosine permease